jgi:hypothetical protein
MVITDLALLSDPDNDTSQSQCEHNLELHAVQILKIILSAECTTFSEDSNDDPDADIGMYGHRTFSSTEPGEQFSSRFFCSICINQLT